MAGLVHEIQMDALNPKARVSDLLRKVKVAAVKLRLGEVEAWVHAELNGYTGELPAYRVIYGHPEYLNPYNGWQPLVSRSARINDMLSRSEVRQSISSLEEIVRKSEDGILRMLFNGDQLAVLNEMMSIPVGRAGLRVSIGQGHDIVEAVRNQVLDWALALEGDGVHGEGFTFSAEERGRAKGNPVTYNIGNIGTFAGNLGEGNASGSITATQNATVSNTFAELAAAIDAQVPDHTKRQELVKAVEDMEKAAPDRSTFAKAYGRFMSAASDHMTVVSPFLPALAAYLS